MRKLAPAAFLVSGIIVFGGLFIAAPAHAEDDEQATSTDVLISPKPQDSHPPRLDKNGTSKLRPSKEPHLKRDELEQKYGKEGRLSVPPLVIRPKRDTDEVSEDTQADIDLNQPVKNSNKSPNKSPNKLNSGSTATIDKTGAASAGSAPAPVRSGNSSDSSGSGSSAGKASAGFIAINPAAKNSVVAPKAGTMVDPKLNAPIDISKAQLTKKTPADVFLQAAQVGLYAMGVGAIALALIAATRSIRRK